MRADVKRKWVKALTSGKFRQITGNLYDEDLRGYCCLGVLRRCMDRKDEAERSGYLTDEQLTRFGLGRGEQKRLAHLNDKGVPFDMIAGLIDEAL